VHSVLAAVADSSRTVISLHGLRHHLLDAQQLTGAKVLAARL